MPGHSFVARPPTRRIRRSSAASVSAGAEAPWQCWQQQTPPPPTAHPQPRLQHRGGWGWGRAATAVAACFSGVAAAATAMAAAAGVACSSDAPLLLRRRRFLSLQRGSWRWQRGQESEQGWGRGRGLEPLNRPPSGLPCPLRCHPQGQYTPFPEEHYTSCPRQPGEARPPELIMKLVVVNFFPVASQRGQRQQQ